MAQPSRLAVQAALSFRILVNRAIGLQRRRSDLGVVPTGHLASAYRCEHFLGGPPTNSIGRGAMTIGRLTKQTRVWSRPLRLAVQVVAQWDRPTAALVAPASAQAPALVSLALVALARVALALARLEPLARLVHDHGRVPDVKLATEVPALASVPSVQLVAPACVWHLQIQPRQPLQW